MKSGQSTVRGILGLGGRALNLWGAPMCRVLLGLGLFPAAAHAQHTGEDTQVAIMVNSLKNNLNFPSGASLHMTVEGKGAWHNAPEAEVAPYSTKRTDAWVARSDSERFGKEVRRETPDGADRRRTVYVNREQWTFAYDLGAAPDAPILGQLVVRSPVPRGTRPRVPLTDYLDRAFVMPSRATDHSTSLNVVGDQVLIDGHLCQEVGGNWNNRQVSFWLDPEYGWLPRRYTMHLDCSLVEFDVLESFVGGATPPLLAPSGMEELLKSPQSVDERLSGIVLDRSGAQHYIARATLEKTVNFAGGVSHTENLILEVSELSFAPDPASGPFLTFSDVLRDGTPVEEHLGNRRLSAEQINYYAWQKGELLPAVPPSERYWPRLWNDLKRLAYDFSFENLKRVDSKFLMAVCTMAALTINGAMAYTAHRRKKSTVS